MDPLYTFGYTMAKLTHQREFAAIGLLCLAIKDSGRGFKHLGYDDYKEVFENYLPKQLEKAQLADRDRVISELMKVLKENQSIFTLSTYE